MTTGETTGAGGAGQAAEERGVAPVPWDVGEGGAVAAFVRTLVACLRHPGEFFGRVARSDDRWSAIGFALVMHVVGFSAAAGWHLVWEREELALALIRVLIAPLWVLVSVWAGSETMHGILGLLGAKRRSRAVTHRAVAYCYATALLGVVPIVGLRAGLAAALVYQIVALRRVHEVPAWKAVAAVVGTWALFVGGVVILSLGADASDASPPS
jgi:cytochrome c oxidase subunit IV